MDAHQSLAAAVSIPSSELVNESGLLEVHFRPFLWEERHAWVLRVLRKEQARAVLDIGCGEGSLLSTLCQPPQTLFDPAFQEIENPAYRDLYLERLAGLDIIPTELVKAERVVAPPPPAVQPAQKTWIRDPVRWNPLEVKLWQGSLDSYNPEFDSYDFMVAMEVIEHLPEDVLPHFAPMILGCYKPKCLLVTTPNFSFNVLFTKPGCVDPGAFPDPTGRTNRHFRHDDHKFEWTEDEFRQWCEDAATAFGYDVEVGGVGEPIADDPYGRPAPFASQTAVFRRKDPLSKHPRPAPSVRDIAAAPHILTACHIHEAHPSAGIRQPLHEIRRRICEALDESQYGDTTIRELWNDWKIPFMCGGSLACLLETIQEGGSDWEVKATDESRRNRTATEVIWKAFVPKVSTEPEYDHESSDVSEIDVDPYDSEEHDEKWPAPHNTSVALTESNDWGWGADTAGVPESGGWGAAQDWGTDIDDTTADDTSNSAWAQKPA
ncbi:hypothetical protein CALCODRAFT_441923 [Calocera cornea HHB12733]|uniref:Small RNA 2'-O-methyltransferase n=1 Tax=Calocera cornea HHB12733 TaxID=1353952 RepID=A0A165D784_9BASI|nr:hypothetical protein CALCODRAFT_441923 [Calocera cornea HHB12733]